MFERTPDGQNEVPRAQLEQPIKFLNFYVWYWAVVFAAEDIRRIRQAILDAVGTLDAWGDELVQAHEYLALLDQRLGSLERVLGNEPITEDRIPQWALKPVKAKVNRIIENMVIYSVDVLRNELMAGPKGALSSTVVGQHE